jgi:hypothetical protein
MSMASGIAYQLDAARLTGTTVAACHTIGRGNLAVSVGSARG